MNHISHNNIEDIKKEFLGLKELSGNPRYVACFGKYLVEKSDPLYELSKQIGKLILSSGFAVLHGGYSGTMDAVSEGANEIILNKPEKKNWNIGVPMRAFDGNVERAKCVHLSPASNILDRKRVLVDMCDMCVVLPVGGMGTLLETIEIFHVNQINKRLGGVIKPIIFFGDNWKELMDDICAKLDLKGQSDGSEFVHYVNSLEQLEKLLEIV